MVFFLPESLSDPNTLLTGIIAVPIICILFYKFYYRFYLITIGKLTRASFDVNLINCADLFIAYSFSTLLFFILYYYASSIISVSLPAAPSNQTAQTITSYKNDHLELIFILISFLVLYFGRVISKQQGSIFGKLFYAPLFISGSIVFLLNNFYKDLISTDMFMNTLYGCRHMMLFGPLILASLGELILFNAKFFNFIMKDDKKSTIAIDDLFPSSYEIMTGNISAFENNIYKINSGSAILSKIRDMLSDECVINIMCVTKSLWAIETISTSITNRYEDNSRNQYFIPLYCRIMKSPEDIAKKDFLKREAKKPFFWESFKLLFDDTPLSNYDDAYSYT